MCGVVFLVHCIAEDMAGTARYLGDLNPRGPATLRVFLATAPSPCSDRVSHHLLPRASSAREHHGAGGQAGCVFLWQWAFGDVRGDCLFPADIT